MKYWKEILIGILLVSLVVFMTLWVRKPTGKSYRPTIDSLVKVNKNLNTRVARMTDSIGMVVQVKEKRQKALEAQLVTITAKYIKLRNKEPSHDTIVKTYEVLVGKECLEKMPVLMAEVTTLKEEVECQRELNKIKTDQNIALQGQFDRAIVTNNAQERDNKRLDRRRKWNKIWAVAATTTTIILGTAVVVGAVIQ